MFINAELRNYGTKLKVYFVKILRVFGIFA